MQTIKLGPYIDESDGRTVLTALSFSSSDFKAYKQNRVCPISIFGIKNIGNGYYLVAMSFQTSGSICVVCNKYPALPVWKDIYII